jgi:hypothetical protein
VEVVYDGAAVADLAALPGKAKVLLARSAAGPRR